MAAWLVCLLLAAFCPTVGAAEPSSAAFGTAFGTIDALSGSADASDAAGNHTALATGSTVASGQTVTTGPDSELHIVTVDGAFIALRPDTVFRVDDYQAAGDADTDKVFMSLLKGSMRSITGWIGKYRASAYRLDTPTATIGIRGTDHETTVIVTSDTDEAGTYDTVNEGKTVLSNAQGATEVTPGRHAFASWHKTMAPLFLSHRPYFWLHRRLRLEQRIAARKTYLWQHLEQLRNTRIQARRQARLSSAADNSAERRDARKQRMQQRREQRMQQKAKAGDEVH